jgi:hypothetical protein
MSTSDDDRWTQLADLPPVDLDEIEMRWAGTWSESDDGQVRPWLDDIARLIAECRRTRIIANRYYEEMVRRTPGSAASAER